MDNRYSHPRDMDNRYNHPRDINNRYNHSRDMDNRYNHPRDVENRYNHPRDMDNRYNHPRDIDNRYNHARDMDNRYNHPRDINNRYNHAYLQHKGDPGNPDSYRGITLVSSVGKVFTSILNSRLTKYADLVDMIPNAQAGFRKGYSTTDNIFCLYVLIDIYIYVVWEKLYCTFIDFKKALDTVWRLGLWQKLVKNIDCRKVLKVILKMHNRIKSYVMQNDDISGFFTCDIGCDKGKIYLLSSSRFSLQI
jgi:hypothetical protein